MSSKSLSLTGPEALFRQCLLDCRQDMQHVPGMNDLVLRFTGGWVRDKLLGVPSHDIDVALSSMTGWQFGQAMQDFMKVHGPNYERKAAEEGFKAQLKDIHKIAANPEKSKHLETITTRMFGIDVDFVNLRKEVYLEDSRNPQMEFGTAEEDALRRDATVNALFYNLDTQAVEDYTGQGLDDMASKIIRTPLEPYQTFKDDPLRILRLIRFACRLNYQIEESAKKSMADKTIHEALKLKISRERVGVEIDKIMRGPDPFTGMVYINQFDLFDTVFDNPQGTAEPPDPNIALASYQTLQRILDEKSTLYQLLRPHNDPKLSWLLAAYTPWTTSSMLAYEASREGIKATNTESKILKDAIDLRPAILDTMRLVEQGTATRSDVGMALRKCKDAWRSHILFSMLYDVATSDQDHGFTTIADRYQKFLLHIQERSLEDAHKIAPILNGNQIMTALRNPKAGPWLTRAIEVVVRWQFDTSDPTKEQAAEMIASRRAEFGLD
ncbi:hypothetical protein B0A52_08639 [Exophiala mesophila]|uniref:Poly A polymerase head domain-containing protein n=1 Tax=Exophiala mesophila TaxID=212818 RepID=A0A438MTZ9_EXOME|nr:hypothetical protein B0A52_08639 [Exophiala mesophila]